MYNTLLLFNVLALLFSNAWCQCTELEYEADNSTDCLSWRLSVEVNNVRNWWTVPEDCLAYVKQYMVGGQYEKDLQSTVDLITSYMEKIELAGDGMDAWVLDVDDTALSNLEYYKGRKFGGMPFDRFSFNNWAMRGRSVALPAILDLYNKLKVSGFKVFFLTGRDESQRKVTQRNLQSQGYNDYDGLILRGHFEKGKGAVVFKSHKRQELIENGYYIWGNVGDQWSDITGDYVGNRTFKLPNPMYFVP
ncbi:hypothetical protein SUGI_0501780 [Cryptomeria japonica]|nr:hypothetical protein SUGI_0501780 [Cryptomeria japonica]